MSKPSEEFEQAYDNFLAGCDVDTTMLDCAEFMFNAGRESVGKAEAAAQPYAHIYEFDSAAFGTHRSFSPSQWNGMKPTRTVAVYTHPAQPVAKLKQWYDENQNLHRQFEMLKPGWEGEAFAYPTPPAEVVRELYTAAQKIVDRRNRIFDKSMHKFDAEMNELEAVLAKAKEHGL